MGAGPLEPLRQANSEDACIRTPSSRGGFKATTVSLLLLVSGASGDGVKVWFRGKLKDS